MPRMRVNACLTTGKLYAQASKGFVEIVRMEKPPSVTRTYLRRKVWDSWLGRHTERRIPIVSFDSQDVLATFNHRKFGDLTGHTLRPGVVWEIPAELESKLVQ